MATTMGAPERTYYAVVVNVPGYLPESDPIVCETMQEARVVAKDEAERIEEAELDYAPDDSALVIVSRDFANGEYWLERPDSAHDLGLHVSIVETDEAPEE